MASELMSEEELKELFAPLAKEVVLQVYDQVGKEIKKMVKEVVSEKSFVNTEQKEIGAECLIGDASDVNAELVSGTWQQVDGNIICVPNEEPDPGPDPEDEIEDEEIRLPDYEVEDKEV